MKVSGIFSAIKTSVAGLSGQLKRMEVISENIANAQSAPDANGNVYQKKVVVADGSERSRQSRFDDQLKLKMRTSEKGHLPSAGNGISKKQAGSAKDRLKVEEIPGEQLIYNPGHPRADENGFVKMPNVNVIEEMVDLISVSRTYEANVTVLNAAKQMAKKALEI